MKSTPAKGAKAAKHKDAPRAPLQRQCDLCKDAMAVVWCEDCKMQLCTAEGCDDDMHRV